LKKSALKKFRREHFSALILCSQRQLAAAYHDGFSGEDEDGALGAPDAERSNDWPQLTCSFKLVCGGTEIDL